MAGESEARAPARAFLLHSGRRLPVGVAGITIGRGDQCDLMLSGERISREHARVEFDDGGYWLVDLGSRHGTTLNGERLRGERAPPRERRHDRDRRRGRALPERRRDADGVAASCRSSRRRRALRRRAADASGATPRTTSCSPTRTCRASTPRSSAADGRVELVDLGSRNGTRVNGAARRAAPRSSPAPRSASARTGSSSTATSFVARDERGALRLDARGARVRVERQADPRADVALDRARRARRDHRRERRGQEHAAQGAGRRHAARSSGA